MQMSDDQLSIAEQCIKKGNLPQAELLCRQILDASGEHPWALSLLGIIAVNVNCHDFAVEYFQRALQADPAGRDAEGNLLRAKKEREQYNAQRNLVGMHVHVDSSMDQRFLLIKAWGYGFWADMDHVLGVLLLAEITGRIPVVHWGDNSLFKDGECKNAFDQFFEPISEISIDDLLKTANSYYPPKWNTENLLANDINKWEGPYARAAGLYFLNRDEDVIVSDFHTYVMDLEPWIAYEHPLHGMTVQELYRYLYKKYIRLNPDIVDEVGRFWQERMQNGSVLAVHVRGSDKANESQELKEINDSYHAEIASYLSRNEIASIFLLTDEQDILEDYVQRYQEMLIYTDCVRTSNATGIHRQQHPSRARIGIDVVVDTCLAARCDYFIGNGHSNVSTSILHMKDWKPGEYTILGGNRLLYTRNLFLHNW